MRPMPIALAALLAWTPYRSTAQVATPLPNIPRTVEGYVVTFEVTALAPEMKPVQKAAPEAQILAGKLRQQARVVSKAWLTKDLSRQEIQSSDFVLPQGTLVLHAGGDKFYVIADPKARSYLVMDSANLLEALEGGSGIVNSQYEARVQHTQDRKTIAGLPCRKSIVTVTYVSTVPFENSTVMVQQKNDIEVWHTPQLVSAAAMDHFFFKFQRDKTGAVRKVLGLEVGFPMEVRFVVTQGAGKRAQEAQPGSFEMRVTEVLIDKKIDSSLFQIPPPGYQKTERNPYFSDAGAAGARHAAQR
jgi:hypothetical protein